MRKSIGLLIFMVFSVLFVLGQSKTGSVRGKLTDTLFKESLAEFDEVGEAIAAFANQSGGEVFVGVKNNGDIIGLGTVNDATLLKTTQIRLHRLRPRLEYQQAPLIYYHIQ